MKRATYCINEKCKRNCLRKNIPTDKPIPSYLMVLFNHKHCKHYLKDERKR